MINGYEPPHGGKHCKNSVTLGYTHAGSLRETGKPPYETRTKYYKKRYFMPPKTALTFFLLCYLTRA
jgi:hypothetical protein